MKRMILSLSLLVTIPSWSYPGFFHSPTKVVHTTEADGSRVSETLPESVKKYWNSSFLFHSRRNSYGYAYQATGSSFKIGARGNKVYIGTALHNIRGQGGTVCPVSGACERGVSIKHNFGKGRGLQLLPVSTDAHSAGNVRVVKIDRANDLALLEVTSPTLADNEKFPPIPIANKCPRVGDKQFAICYPPAWNSGGRQTTRIIRSNGHQAKLHKFWSGGKLTSTGYRSNLAKSSIDSIRGSSGCGQMNDRGELTALLTGGPTSNDKDYRWGEQSYITRCEAFKRFFRSHGVSPEQVKPRPRPQPKRPQIIQAEYKPDIDTGFGNYYAPQPDHYSNEDDQYNDLYQVNIVGE
jgi:hypothetical protein